MSDPPVPSGRPPPGAPTTSSAEERKRQRFCPCRKSACISCWSMQENLNVLNGLTILNKLGTKWISPATHAGEPAWLTLGYTATVHSKKNLSLRCICFFFKCCERYSSFFFLFRGLEDAFVLLTFHFKYVPPWESNFPFSRGKSAVLPFHPQASNRCRCVCRTCTNPTGVAARKGQSPMNLHCNCTGTMQRGRQ